MRPAGTAPAAASARSGPLRAAADAVPVVSAVAVVALQIAYPLTPEGAARDRLSVAIIAVFFAASVSHALRWRGPRFAAVLVAVTACGGMAVEALGVATGWPFGAYRYTGSLGPRLLGVPLVIGMAWTMMAYPAHAVARRVTDRPIAGTLLAGWALASWDLFLDPQMVAAGQWVWETGGPAVLGVPLSNFAGWAVVATAMMGLVRRADRARVAKRTAGSGAAGRVDDRVPCGLYLWTYGSSVLAHAVFLGLPGSALLGGVGMGTVVLALAVAARR